MSTAVAPETAVKPAAPAARTAVPAQAWWMLAVLFGCYVLSFLDRYIVTMLVEPIKRDLGLTDFQIGLILGPAFGLFFGLFGLPVGWAVDRYPRRWVVFTGVVVWSIATAASGFARGFWGLFAARVGVGAGEAGLSPAAMSMLADAFPRNRLATAVGIYQSAVKVGSAFAYSVGGLIIGLTAGEQLVLPLIGELHSWQLVFLAVGAPGLIFALLLFTFSEPARRGRSSAEPVGVRQLFVFLGENRRLFLLMFPGFVLIALCSYGLAAWAPAFLERRFAWKPEHYGLALSVISILAAATLALKGWIVDWLYSRGMKDAPIRFFSWLLIGSLPVSAVVFLLPNPWLVLVLYGLIQMVSMPSMLYLASALQLLSPNELRGQLSALAYSMFTLLGMGAGPLLVGAITDFVFGDESKLGWSLTLLLMVCVPIAWVLLRMCLPSLRVAIERSEALEAAG